MTLEEDVLRTERDDALMRLDQAVRKISKLEDQLLARDDDVERLENEIDRLEERLEEGGDPEFLRMILKLARKRDFTEIEEQIGRRVGF